MNIHSTHSFFARFFRAVFLFIAANCIPLHAQRLILTDQKASPVVIESASVSTEITGRIAVTTFDLVFRNPNGRVLEGNFEFPLLEKQTVVSFALDLNGQLREAVPVEKNRGRVVFEEIERRGVDPALLEQTAGNNYRARVYPIPARGTRRIVIAYQEDLAGTTATPLYRLPLNFPGELETFKLSVKVQSSTTTPAKINTTLPLQLPDWKEGKFLEIKRKRFVARGIFELELPLVDHPKVLTERRGDDDYFYAEIPAEAIKPVMRPAPSVIGLLWDASGSGQDRDHERELAMLDVWFKIVGDVEVKLISFRNQADAPIPFKIKKGDWSRLRQALEAIVYDGGTSFDGLTDDPTVNEWLMFSDGVLNYGVAQTVGKLPFRAPVHTVLASPKANPAFLRGLARQNRGEFANLLRATPEKSAELVRQESLRVLKIERNPGQVAQIFPESNTPIDADGLVITGILKKKTTTIRVRIGHHDSDAREVELHLQARENSSHLAARAWAAAKIANLELDPVNNWEDIRRTSQEFGIVSADTSLIVLETLQDYLQYDILPPEELRAEWEARRQTTAGFNGKGNSSKLDEIARLYNEKIKWWETDFSREARSAAATKTALAATAAAAAVQEPPPANLPRRRSGSSIPTLEEMDETIVLSPFEVTASSDIGYTASNTLAGSRINTAMGNFASTGRSGSPSRSTRQEDPETANPAEAPAQANITLRRWNPAEGYLDRLRRAAPDERYSVYIEERTEHVSQPGFYLDVAEFFFQNDDLVLAHRILSNLAELQLDDPALLRVLAHRLVQAGHPELALPLFERVLQLRPEEPQSLRDVALVCSALKQHQRAVDLLWQVVAQSWNPRFPEIELIALNDLNSIVATCGEKLDLSQIDSRFLKNLPVGLRVVLTWDTDACDIDLWVADPSGELAIYNHPRTAQGGRMSRDFTGGYGPEEFLLRNPEPGKYTVRINYFGDRRQTTLGPVTVQAKVTTGFGTPSAREECLTLRLTGTDKNLKVGEIEIGQLMPEVAGTPKQ